MDGGWNSHLDIDEYFVGIGTWMKNDVNREIQLARASSNTKGQDSLAELAVPPGGGNLLAALGLAGYTEALGLLRVWSKARTECRR